MRRYLLVLACVCVVAMLVGCSSGGPRGTVTAGSRSASGQSAAAMFIQQWGQILWGLVTNQTGTEIPSAGPPDFDPINMIFSQTFTTADGTEFVMKQFLMTGVVQLDITYTNGGTQTVTQQPPVPVGPTTLQLAYDVVSSDGLTVAYTATVDDKGTIFDSSDDTTVLEGTATLPNGETQQFTVTTENGTTTVVATNSDGSTFTLVVPLGPPMFMFPDFTQPATGTYVGPDFNMQFTLNSTPSAPGRWARLTSDFGGGLTGEFDLSADFSGSGQLLQDGQPIALVSWTATGETEVNFLTAETSATSAAGAALDFLTHRWETLTALMGPGP